MSNIDQTAAIPATSSLLRLFLPEHLPATLMLAGGVMLYAVESYITATIAPSIVRDIGGLALFSWAPACSSPPPCSARFSSPCARGGSGFAPSM
ncbi:hypothetical protein FHX03_000150 [Rhizobium sp. BK456]|nr:hypothetical protein [Rhizobium sp. BK456]